MYVAILKIYLVSKLDGIENHITEKKIIKHKFLKKDKSNYYNEWVYLVYLLRELHFID